jgi:hypothetical protein
MTLLVYRTHLCAVQGMKICDPLEIFAWSSFWACDEILTLLIFVETSANTFVDAVLVSRGLDVRENNY